MKNATLFFILFVFITSCKKTQNISTAIEIKTESNASVNNVTQADAGSTGVGKTETEIETNTSTTDTIIEQNDSNLKSLPSIELKNMNGKTVNISELGLKGPIVISFWATWCTPCKKELNAINELYQDWQDETGVTLVAVSIDDSKTKNIVPIYVNGKGWEYMVLMDPNGNLKRAMGVNNIPHTFLVNSNGKIVYSHNNYASGDEEHLYDEILKLVK